MQNALICLVAFGVALIIQLSVVPQVLLISREKQLFDIPDSRKSHTNPISRLGGVTFFPVIMLSFLPVLSIQAQWLGGSAMTYDSSLISNCIFLLSGGVLLMLIGVKDDLIGTSAFRKFIAQSLAALLLISSGNYFNTLHGLFGIHELPIYIGVPLTVLFVVYVTNSFNLIDGVDGLAGSLGCIASFALGILLLLEETCPYCIIAFALLGVLLPFLHFNFSRTRKIFMGDTGSLTLGYLLAFLAIHYSMSTVHVSNETPSLSIVLVWSVMFVPLFDTLRVMCIRAWNHRPLFSPDRNHIHHKLLDLGYSHKKTTIILSLCACAIIPVNILLHYCGVNITVILLLNCAAGVLFNYCVNRQKNKN